MQILSPTYTCRLSVIQRAKNIVYALNCCFANILISGLDDYAIKIMTSGAPSTSETNYYYCYPFPLSISVGGIPATATKPGATSSSTSSFVNVTASGSVPSHPGDLEELQSILHFPEEVALRLTDAEYQLFYQVTTMHIPFCCCRDLPCLLASRLVYMPPRSYYF